MKIINNPTIDQLRALKGIVYLIQNEINKKCYVGQTEKTFKERYSLKNWKRNIQNKYLREDIKIFGEDNFSLAILEHGIFDAEELNKLEEFWAIKFNSYCPGGYNVSPCGKNSKRLLSKEYLENMSNRKSLPFKIKEYTTGIIYNGSNLKRFCKEKNLSYSRILYILRLKGRTHKGFCHLDATPEERLKNMNQLNSS